MLQTKRAKKMDYFGTAGRVGRQIDRLFFSLFEPQVYYQEIKSAKLFLAKLLAG